MTMSKKIAKIYSDRRFRDFVSVIRYMKRRNQVGGMLSIPKECPLDALAELTGAIIERNHPDYPICRIEL